MPTLLDHLLVRIGPEFVGGAALRRLESGVARAQAKLDGLATGFTRIGAGLTAGAALTVKTLFGFEVAQNQLQATLDVTADKMAALREQAKELGRTTEFSATQTTEAQVQLAQAGFDLNQILASTPAVLALASAGQLSMAEAAKLTANQLRAFNLDVDQAGRVTDVLAKTASTANTSVSQLGPAFRQVAPIAAEAGLSIEQTAGYIALLRDRGFAAEQSGTALRSILGRLVDPSKEVKDALEGIGLDPDFVLNQVKAGNLQAVLQALRTAGLDVGDAMKLFGQEAGAAGIVLANNADAAAMLTTELEAAEGTAVRMASTQNQKLVGAVRNTISAFEGLQIAIGESGLGSATEKLLRRLTDLINRLTESDPWVRKLIAGALAGGPALLALGFALKAVSLAFGWLVPVGALIAGIGHVTGITTAAQWAWNAAVGAGPRIAAAASAAMLSLQAIGVAAATALNVAWSRLYLTLKFGGIKGLVLSLWAAISAAGLAAFGAVKGASLSAFAAVRGAGVAAYAGVRAAALATIAPIRAVYLAVAQHGVFGAMRLAAIGAFAGLKVAAIGAFAAVKAVAVGAFAALSTVGLPVILAIVAAATILIAAWKPVSTFFVGLWTGVVGNLGLVGDAFGRLLDALGPVGGAVRDVFGFLRDALGWLANLLPDLTAEGESVGAGIVRGMAAAIDAITAIVEFIRGISLAEAGAALMRTLVDGIMSAAGWVTDAVKSALSDVRDLLPFSDARTGPLSRLTQSGRAIVTTIAEGVQSAPTTLTDALRDALPDLPDLGLPEFPELQAALPDMPSFPDLGLPPLPELRAALPDMPSLDIPSLDVLAPPLPIGPVPPPAAAGATSLTVTLGEGAITIHAPGSDAEQIAERIGGELENQWRALAEQVDSRFRA